MIATYAQAERLMRVFTPLGKDVLLLVGFRGQEGISQPYRFELEVVAQNKAEVPFEKLLGQMITVDLLLPRGSRRRQFHGVCSQVSQGPRDFTFTTYWLQIVPPLWLLTKRAQSRIFQHVTVPEILKQVFDGLNVAYEITGTWHPRDYCVQYRESDFAFASRLMEEEGIFYFFKHTAGGLQMVVANTPQSHPELPEAGTLTYEELKGGLRPQDRVTEWRKVQELRSGKVTLWDHCFELPHRHLEATRTILDQVPVGEAVHRQRVANNDRLEVYDYPGAYAQRFDGVGPYGADRSADLQRIYEDNQRTAALRMQQEASAGLFTEARSTCRQMTSGHKFTLTRHWSADGPYVVTGVAHEAKLHADYRSGGPAKYDYTNTFTCVPLAQPFRPARVTPRPTVRGTQTAVVVGPREEEIFVDKYGRVKVQFHWDRLGKNDAESSCWVRVTQPWAGKRWGAHFWPRVGQEVIVDFLEGDPDRPIVVGTVYNADQVPPYDLPADRTRSGVKTRSSPGGTPDNFNELRFEDKKGAEEVYFHAERDFNRVVENNDNLVVGSAAAPDGSQTIDVWKNRTEVVRTGDETVAIAQGNRTHSVKLNDTLIVESGDRLEVIQAGSSTTQAEKSIELRVGSSFIRLDPASITIQSPLILVQATALMQQTAPLLQTDALLTNHGSVVYVNDAVLSDISSVVGWVQGMAALNLEGGVTFLGPPKGKGAVVQAVMEGLHGIVAAAPSIAVPAVKSALLGSVSPVAAASIAGGVFGAGKSLFGAYKAFKAAKAAGALVPTISPALKASVFQAALKAAPGGKLATFLGSTIADVKGLVPKGTGVAVGGVIRGGAIGGAGFRPHLTDLLAPHEEHPEGTSGAEEGSGHAPAEDAAPGTTTDAAPPGPPEDDAPLELTRVTARSARQVCGAYHAKDNVQELLHDDPTPEQFLERLTAEGLLVEAAQFLAHALPRREAAWWACAGAREAYGPGADPKVVAALDAAERWAAAPTEANRRAAEAAGNAAGGTATAAGSVALAAFYSEGSLGPPGKAPVPAGAALSGGTVLTALMQTALLNEPAQFQANLGRLLLTGIAVAAGDLPPPEPPGRKPPEGHTGFPGRGETTSHLPSVGGRP